MSWKDLHKTTGIDDVLKNLAEEIARLKFANINASALTQAMILKIAESITFTDPALKQATSPRFSWVINFGHDATVTAGTFVAGKFNNALSFNGTTTEATITHTSNLLLAGEISILLWIKTSATANQIVVNKRTLTTNGWAISINATANKITGRFLSTDLTSTTSINDNTFHLIELKRDSANLATLSVDNIQEASATITGGISTTANILLGKEGTTFYNGQIDEFRILNRAITTNERDLIFDSNSPFAKGSIVWLKFDESSGNGIDSSGLVIGYTDVNS